MNAQNYSLSAMGDLLIADTDCKPGEFSCSSSSRNTFNENNCNQAAGNETAKTKMQLNCSIGTSDSMENNWTKENDPRVHFIWYIFLMFIISKSSNGVICFVARVQWNFWYQGSQFYRKMIRARKKSALLTVRDFVTMTTQVKNVSA